MRERKEESPWNYANKFHLLEAELYSSSECRDSLAKASYSAAIEASKSSKFVHEQGLSCELAALHFKRREDMNTALAYFEQQTEKWGSQIKVDAVIRQMESIQNQLAN